MTETAAAIEGKEVNVLSRSMDLERDYHGNYKATYTLAHMDGAYQIRYTCALCGFHYTTGWIKAGSEAEARLLTEYEARASFNGCRRCGRWVCDSHYNMEKLMCVECADARR